MAVPTTPTATDKQEEVRKLNIEIAGLTRAKDLATDAANTAKKAVEDATRRAKDAEEHLRTLETAMAGSAAEIREFVAYCRNILQTALLSMQELEQYAKEMQQKVDALTEAITKLQGELDTLRETIAKENTAHSARRDDLEIYEGRIRTAAAAVGIKIKL